ncbi:endonuclease [Escherichia coli RS218]|nr:endonuclease [Escherichia coli RS218]
MLPRTSKACRVRGCRHTTTDPSGYCKSHKSEGWKQYKPGQSCHQRGYGSRGCPSCSPVLCGGGRNRTLTQILVGRCYSFLDYPDAIHARAV